MGVNLRDAQLWSGASACLAYHVEKQGGFVRLVRRVAVGCDARLERCALGEASPYNVNPGLKVGAIPFTIGTDDSECGVTGHTVIVHKGCPASNPTCTDFGSRIGCCVLE